MQTKPNGLDRYLLWILLVGLVLRIALFVIAQPWTPKGEDTILHGSRDSLSYHYLAHDLVIYGRYGGNSYADPENLDPAIRPLGYALFLAFWYWLFAPRIWIPLLVQIALSTASVYLVYRIVQMMASLPAARFAAFLYAVYPNAILHANSIMTEVLYNFFALTAVYFWARFHLQQQASLRSLLMLAGLVSAFCGAGCVCPRSVNVHSSSNRNSISCCSPRPRETTTALGRAYSNRCANTYADAILFIHVF
jgi:hypothetical protein